MQLKRLLEELYRNRPIRYREIDPVAFCHRFTDPRDQEIVGLVASCLAYGNVAAIKTSVEHVVAAMMPSPLRFIESFQPQNFPPSLTKFKHRFNTDEDVAALFWAIKQMVCAAGSLQGFFVQRDQVGAADYTPMLNAVVRDILDLDYSGIFFQKTIPKTSSFPFLFPSPSAGSACKRLCMYLRWMVRPADGVDLGVWHGLKPAKLTIPVDAHIRRISRYLGLTFRKTADWKMAREITTALQKFDPVDPVKYDFVLCHLGISQGCVGKHHMERCRGCTLVDVCSGGISRA